MNEKKEKQFNYAFHCQNAVLGLTEMGDFPRNYFTSQLAGLPAI